MATESPQRQRGGLGGDTLMITLALMIALRVLDLRNTNYVIGQENRRRSKFTLHWTLKA